MGITGRLETAAVKHRHIVGRGSFAGLDEAVFKAQGAGVVDELVILPGGQAAVNFRLAGSLIKWRILIHKADEDRIAKGMPQPVQQPAAVWQQPR